MLCGQLAGSCGVAAQDHDVPSCNAEAFAVMPGNLRAHAGLPLRRQAPKLHRISSPLDPLDLCRTAGHSAGPS